MTIGDRIRYLRETNGWSQLELAEKIGINNSVLSRIEAGKRPVEHDELKKFAKIFNVSSDWLLFDGIPVKEPVISLVQRASRLVELLPLSLRLEEGDSYELRSIQRIFSRLSPSFQRLSVMLHYADLGLR